MGGEIRVLAGLGQVLKDWVIFLWDQVRFFLGFRSVFDALSQFLGCLSTWGLPSRRRHPGAAAALRPGLPPEPLELQQRGGRGGGGARLRGARPALRRALARHRARRRQALLHLGPQQVPPAPRHARAPGRQETQGLGSPRGFGGVWEGFGGSPRVSYGDFWGAPRRW